MSVRLSVCLSYAGFVSKRLNLSNFSPSGSHTILVFPCTKHYGSIPMGTPNGGLGRKGMKKSRFSTNISLYLGNDTRYGHSYYGMWIRNRTQAFEWYDFEWRWVTWNNLAKYSMTRSIARSLWDSRATCSFMQCYSR